MQNEGKQFLHLGYHDYRAGLNTLGITIDELPDAQPLYETLGKSYPFLGAVQSDVSYTLPAMVESRVSPKLPRNVLFHVYDAQFDDRNWKPNLLGELSLEALAAYEMAFHEANPWSTLKVYVAGDHLDERGVKISSIYKHLINAWLYGRRFCDVNAEFEEVDYRGAHDSTGELDYLARNIGGENAVSISVAAHRPYISRLCQSLGPAYENITPISAEAILVFFGQGEKLDRFIHKDVCRYGNRNCYPQVKVDSYLIESSRIWASRKPLYTAFNMAGPFEPLAIRALQELSNVAPKLKRGLLSRMNRN